MGDETFLCRRRNKLFVDALYYRINHIYIVPMNISSIMRRNWSKVLLLLLAFTAIIFVASMLFACGLGFQKRTMFLRGTYMVAAVAWAFFTIRWLCVKFDFARLWQSMMNDLYSHQEDFVLKIYRDYQDLVSKYPMAIAEYESHCWRQNPRPSTPEIMESALSISEMEWIEREKKARARVEGKKH